ncbi:hypothetical protein [Bacillus toyonensis]|uniref:hypothetical protein n=1 Tax=Bacillus toyonensis TaxID=155322 RepID=UPI002E235620|nr:hypothetical protein [Bacillus toyonensis]
MKITLEELAEEILFASIRTEKQLLNRIDGQWQYRKNKGIEDVMKAIDKGQKNGLGRTRFQVRAVALYLKSVFKEIKVKRNDDIPTQNSLVTEIEKTLSLKDIAELLVCSNINKDELNKKMRNQWEFRKNKGVSDLNKALQKGAMIGLGINALIVESVAINLEKVLKKCRKRSVAVGS